MAHFDPCTTSYVTTYMNNSKVLKALHVPILKDNDPMGSLKLDPWNDAPDTMLPLIKQLIASGTRLWLYSGDIDAVISITATKYAIRKLGLPIRNEWHPGYSNGQVGGHVVGYEGLAFVTVRGAGLEVPSYQPERALTMISSFIQGKLPA